MTLQPATQLPAAALPAIPFPRILCAVDGSRGARAAVSQALTLSRGDGSLTFLAASDVRGYGATRMASLGPHAADEAVQEAKRAARAAGVDATAVIRSGADPRQVILTEARNHDLLVIGTHGQRRPSGFLVGSTAAMALHRAPVPVLIARAARNGAEFPRDILLATDGSPAMASTVMLTATLARRHGSRVVLLHVDAGDPATRHELAEEATVLLGATGVDPIVVQMDGHAPSRIAQVALELPASLIVTGSRMLRGVRALASVSERTGVVAPCSVLVMRAI
jgi:nucleotide-binding universal stress UspA family protein